MGEVQVIGGGGHARVVIATLRDAGEQVVGIYDDDPEKLGMQLDGVPIRGPIVEAGRSSCARTIIAVGSNTARQKVVETLALDWVSAVHPTAYVHETVAVGKGTVIFAGAIVQPGAVLGSHVIINTGATVDHDCQLGDYVHLGPGSNLSGTVRIDEGALLGVGSSARPGVHVGCWAIVGAGAVVVSDIIERTTVVGVPARPVQAS